MTYEQRRSIEKAFVPMDLIENEGRTASLSIYKYFFNNLEDIRWLRLEPKQPAADAEE